MKKIMVYFLLLNSVFGMASEYSYHPSSPIYLGSGFNPYNPTEAYLNCLEPTTTIALETPQNRELSIQIATVKTRHELYSKTNMSASVSGSYGAFSGSGSMTKLDEVTFNENDFNWIIVLKSDMGKYGLANPQLSNSLSKASNDQLFNRCGTEIVTQERRGVMLYALVTVHNMTQSERHEMETKIGGGINTGVYSAEVSAKYQSILQFSYAVGTVAITVEAQGGNGIKELADIVGGGENNFANYSKLPNLVNAYVKNFDPSNAVPLQYFTTSLRAFKDSLPVKGGDFEAVQVGIIYEKYLDAVKTVNRIDSLLSPNNNSGIDINNDQRKMLLDARTVYEKNMNDLYEAGRKCFDEKTKKCRAPIILDSVVIWPKLSRDRLCAMKRDDALLKGYFPQQFYDMAAKRNLVPIISETKQGVEIVGYNTCEKEYLN